MPGGTPSNSAAEYRSPRPGCSRGRRELAGRATRDPRGPLARLARFAEQLLMIRAVALVPVGAILLMSAISPSHADDAADVQLADRYQQAAEKGDATAQMYLGAIHSAGVGRPQSDKEAFAWFSRAADGGNSQAQLILSGIYAIGRGVTQSNPDAYKWALIAATGNNTAEDKNGAHQLMTQLAKRMSDQEIAAAKKQADAWKPNARPIRQVAPRDNAPPTPPPPAPPPNRTQAASEPAKAVPDRVAGLYGMAQQFAKSGNYSEAIRNFDEVLRLSPGDPEALNNRCWARAIVGELDNALKDCNQALQLRPRYGDAFDSRGFVNLRIGRNTNAIDDYDAALSIDPRRASSLYGRGIAKTRRGDADAGKNDIATAKSIQANIADEFAGYGIR
jgi:TPR repeat protein